MIRFILEIFSPFLNKEFLKFLLIGAVNTLSGVILSYIFSFFLNPNLAFICGYFIGLLISFMLNCTITFRNTIKFTKFLKFSVSYIPNFIIQNITVYIIYNLLHWHKLIAYLLAAIIGLPITFLLMKFYTFNQNRT